MFRFVLPSIAVSAAIATATNRLSRGPVAIAASRLIRWSVPTADVVAVAATNVRVAVEIIVPVNVDVVAAPTAPPAPTPAPERPHGDANAKRDRQTSGIISGRRIVNRRIRIEGGTVYHDRIVRGYIHDLWICLFNYDHALAFDDFGFHPLLLS